MEERIDPKDWTIPELLKHVFREVTELKGIITQSNGKLDNYMAAVDAKLEQQRVFYDGVVNELQNQMRSQELKIEKLITQGEEREKVVTTFKGNVKLWIVIGGFIISLLSLGIQLIL